MMAVPFLMFCWLNISSMSMPFLETSSLVWGASCTGLTGTTSTVEGLFSGSGVLLSSSLPSLFAFLFSGNDGCTTFLTTFIVSLLKNRHIKTSVTSKIITSPALPTCEAIHRLTLYPCSPPGYINESSKLPWNTNARVNDNQKIDAKQPTNHFHTVNWYAFISFIPAIIKNTMMMYEASPKQSFTRNCDNCAPDEPITF